MPLTILKAPLRVRHVGSSAYDPLAWRPVTDRAIPFRPKPEGGLWTSPIGGDPTWFSWCAENGYALESLGCWFDLEVAAGARVLVVDGQDDLNLFQWRGMNPQVPVLSLDHCTLLFPLFWPLANDPFRPVDAIHLTRKGLAATSDPEAQKNLSRWDCETVLILRRQCITLDDPVQTQIARLG